MSLANQEVERVGLTHSEGVELNPRRRDPRAGRVAVQAGIAGTSSWCGCRPPRAQVRCRSAGSVRPCASGD